MLDQGTADLDPGAEPLADIEPSDPALFEHDAHWDMFRRLREEDPVHFHPASAYGPYWSITRYADIVEIDSNWKDFSSAAGAIQLDSEFITGPTADSVPIESIISMDPPKHDQQRKAIVPGLSPANLLRLEGLVRERTRQVLDGLPIGEEFDWVSEVSSELTMMMLATLLGWPVDDRNRLRFWSDMIAGRPGDGNVESWDHRQREMKVFAETLLKVREERRAGAPADDLISMLAHTPQAVGMDAVDYIANMATLIVGGNDTTRNTMSGAVLAFHDHPAEWAKFKADPSLVSSLVPEAIRYQTPIPYMSRRANRDVEFRGKTIREGDKVVMWYISGNRDDRAIEDPERFIIDRPRARQHLSFGFGIHRCPGNRVAELQLKILWEEIARKDWTRIEVTHPPVRARANGVRGILSLPVIIQA